MLRRRVPTSGPLKVLFIVPDLTVGGAERHVVTLLPAMDRSRFEPSVVCINQQGPLFAELAATGVPARAFDRPKGELVRGLVKLVGHIRRTRPDMIIARGANAELLGRLAATICRVPRSVVWVHNCGELQPRRRSRRLADRLLEPVTSAYFGVAHGQLQYLSEELGYPVAKVRIVQNGADVARFPFVPVSPRNAVLAAELGIDPGDVVVGIVAVLRPEKDHATFLRAARLVLDQVPRARFLVVGRGRLLPDMTRLAQELGIVDRVIFTGPRTDVADMLAMVDVFSLTSYTIECFPMALLEAMAVGRPAVCTAVGGIPEMIAEGVTGHVVAPRDPVALAARLVELLNDPERAREMGRAARERLESQFSLDRSVRNAELAIEETVGRVRAAVGTSR
ncbi:MAG: glycosyltransferase [Pseudonocardia sp.]